MKSLYVPFLTTTVSFGPSRFVYTKERGARDALAHLVLTWIKALACNRKVAVYCSDVSGAFDRVKAERLIAKLRSKKLRNEVIDVLASWLRQRTARVLVGGKQSDTFKITDMVFQGTVLGPVLWNVCYEDARRAMEELFFEEIMYADDLNACRELPGSTETSKALKY